MEFTHFKDRADAGVQLARQLAQYADNGHVIVLALPRGGVPVGDAIARALHAPLDVLLVRKLGLPGHEEFALGAIASGGIRVLQQAVVNKLHLTPAAVQQIIDREQIELERREQLYRADAPPPRLEGRIVILADDGLATGSTMKVAVEAVRHQKPARLIVAVPVAAPEARDRIGAEVDELVCLVAPPLFKAVSQWYAHFNQTSDEEVEALLAGARRHDRMAELHAQERVPYLMR